MLHYLRCSKPCRLSHECAAGSQPWLDRRAVLHRRLDVLRHPEPRAQVAHDALAKLRSVVPAVPDDVTAVRANAAVQMVAATLFTLGKAPRVPGVLAVSLVPTTLAGHAFWR
jgi:hypothetical protein